MLWITGSFKRREAGGFEGRAAHGSGVGAEIRGWRKWRGNYVEASGARRDRGGVENVGDFAIPGKILRHLELLRSRAASA